MYRRFPSRLDRDCPKTAMSTATRSFFATFRWLPSWKIPGGVYTLQPARNTQKGRLGRGLAAVALAACFWSVAAVGADDETSPPVVELDQLLKLPSSLELEPEVRGGATRAEWRSRFQTAREELAAARAALARTQAKLEDVAGESSAWKMGAPGLGTPQGGSQGPLDYAISTEMKRNREELQRSERRLSELEVEANLAGVPDSWRQIEAPAEGAAQEPGE